MPQIGFRVGNFNNNETVSAGPATTDIGDLLVPRHAFSSGRLWSWGYNIFGQLGDDSTIDKSSPVQVGFSDISWKQISTTLNHVAGIKTNGILWMWGFNQYGQLGNNTIINKSLPIQTESQVWRKVAAGYFHTSAIRTDGTLWSWGYNLSGQLGINSIINKSSPVQTVTGGVSWKHVSCGYNNTAAIKNDGTLWCVGKNNYGQLGINSIVNKSSPTQVAGTTWNTVSCNYCQTAVIKTDNTLWCFGKNDYGQLGINSTVNKSSPTQVSGTNWKYVAVGEVTMSAIKTDGTLWNWGIGGLLGDNKTTDKSSPVQTIIGGTNWKSVSSGRFHTAAIKTDGTLWSWGENGNGQLGNDTIIESNPPIQTIMGGTLWKSVSCGNQTIANTE